MNIIVKQMHNVVMVKVENLPEDMEKLYGSFYYTVKDNKAYFLRCCPQEKHEMSKDYLDIGYGDSENYMAYAFDSVSDANNYIKAISNLFVELKIKEESLKGETPNVKD